MREIKFRALKNGSWQYLIFENGGLKWSGELIKILSDDPVVEWEAFEQFTGLRDRNGEEIYEGDILLWSNGWEHMENKGVVEFENGAFISINIGYLRYSRKIEDHDDGGGSTYLPQVIGNIHENPELLEATNEREK